VGRKVWVAVHRYCGLFAMGLLLVNALTGSVIAFEHEIDAWLNPTLRRLDHDRAPLAPDMLIAHVEQADPRIRVSFFPLDARPAEAYELRVAPRIDPLTGKPWPLDFDRLFIDPATGEVLGRRQWGALKFDRVHLMTFLNVLHRKFQLPGSWGMWLTGAVALAWLASSLVGTYLSLPRRLVRPERGGATGAPPPGFWRRWKPAWQIKRGASWTRMTFDLHRSMALWSLPVAVTLAVSGVYFSLGNEVFRPVVRLFAPITPNPLQALARRAEPVRLPALGVQEAVARARAHLPPPAQSFLPWYASHVPDLGVYRVAFKEDGMRERLLRLRYEQLFIDDQTGELRSITGYHSGTGADRFLIWQYPLHTGRVLGWWGRVLVSLAGLLTASLCVTGLLVWWTKRAASRRRASH
jgi:uncharacterized iron-regulated membrane protein